MTKTNNAQDLMAAVESCLSAGARAALVTRNDDGTLEAKSVEMGQSVVDLKRDLLLHLNEYPFSDEWLEQLRTYCDERLAARRAAKASHGIVIPNWQAKWIMMEGKQ